MTNQQYAEIKKFTSKQICKYSKYSLKAEDVINDAYIRLIENKIAYCNFEIERHIVIAVKYYREPKYFKNDTPRIKTKFGINEHRVCRKCPQNGPQPLGAFHIQKTFPDGISTYKTVCKKCLEGSSTNYYQKHKVENSETYRRTLDKARIKGKKNYNIIRKHPAAYKIFREKKNKANCKYKKRKKEEKLQRGWIPHEIARSPVIMRTKSGKLIAYFSSINQASKIINRNRGTLIKAIKNKRVCAGYLFEYSTPKKKRKPYQKPLLKKNPWNKSPIIARNKNGKIIKVYCSITEAAKQLNRQRTNLSRAIKHKRPFAGTYFEKKV